MGLKKGQTNNPNGRPKRGETLTDALKKRINKDELAENLIELAYHGETHAIRLTASKYVYDRIDGSPKQTIAGDSESPLIPATVKVIFTDKDGD